MSFIAIEALIKWIRLQVDVTDYNEIEEVKRQINADLGIVDILVNNAGLMPKASLRDGHPDVVRRVMEVNVLAHFWVNRIHTHTHTSFNHSITHKFNLTTEKLFHRQHEYSLKT